MMAGSLLLRQPRVERRLRQRISGAILQPGASGTVRSHLDPGLPLDAAIRGRESVVSVIGHPVRRVLNESLVFSLANHTLLPARDGRKIPIADSMALIRNAAGEITGVVLVFRDQTEERKAQLALEEKTQLLQLVFDNMFDLVSVADLEGNFKFVSASHKILKYDLDFLVGRNVLDFVHPDDLPEISSALRDYLAEGDDIRRKEYRYRCADGSYLWIETVGKIIRDDEGNPTEMLFSTRDNTEQKQVEADRPYEFGQQVADFVKFPFLKKNGKSYGPTSFFT
ncbi:MAG TPA: PAS domain S-box protein [Desulfobacteraceae bacterium]|nr:PAS domain S-box protein [Desulfobacteraceae bacterium]